MLCSAKQRQHMQSQNACRPGLNWFKRGWFCFVREKSEVLTKIIECCAFVGQLDFYRLLTVWLFSYLMTLAATFNHMNLCYPYATQSRNAETQAKQKQSLAQLVANYQFEPTLKILQTARSGGIGAKPTLPQIKSALF